MKLHRLMVTHLTRPLPAGRIQSWDDNIGFTNGIIGYETYTDTDYSTCEDGDDFTPCPSVIERQRPIYGNSTGSFVGVEGVKVRARRWFTTHRGFANSSGYYSCDGTFRRRANYSIDWERYEFAIQDGWLNGATYNGPKIKGDWNLNLKNGHQEYYATIFRAAHHYYYKNIKGLRRPPQNSFWRTQMKIRAHLENVSGDGALGTHREERRFLGAQLKIYTYQRESIDTYSTVIHELAHASHWNIWRSSGFDNTQPIVKESWARGVQWELTRMTYPNYTPVYSRLRYTGVVEDLIDGFKTRQSMWFWTEQDSWVSQVRTYQDMVENYTIRQLEDALVNQQTWMDWQNNIINSINNNTSSNVQNSFNFWSTQ